MDPDSFLRKKSCDPNMHLVEQRDGEDVYYKYERLRPYRPMELQMIGFDDDFRLSDEPLECFLHRNNIDECPMEKERKTAAAQRRRNEQIAKKRKERKEEEKKQQNQKNQNKKKNQNQRRK